MGSRCFISCQLAIVEAKDVVVDKVGSTGRHQVKGLAESLGLTFIVNLARGKMGDKARVR